MPDRSYFNRVPRVYASSTVAFGLYLVELMEAQHCLYERIDSSGIATGDAKRRGAGWLPGQADISWSNRMGWYQGFHLLVSVAQQGVITGYGFGSASSHDQYLMATFLAARAQVSPLLPTVGQKA